MNDGENKWGDEYDGYVPALCKLALNKGDTYKISRHLTNLQRDSMGLEVNYENEHDIEIAELIINAKKNIIGL
ncbi:hypothetical protein [uncultured Gimesia sp.]|uniref:hypothetical protein n=1 Tax=uncultured Gimesia sp. TaxID=1678688 RepID=UPI0026149A7B|nr:hypothetical protein [uncultured Gimesia sp.]